MLRQHLLRAIELNVRDRVATAYRTIESRLEDDPVGWGDPVRRYTAARMTTFQRIRDELLVVYSVHDEKPEVWLLDVTPVLGHPLKED